MMRSEERLDDLDAFQDKIYRMFVKKGLNAEDSLDILIMLICSIGKQTEVPDILNKYIVENLKIAWSCN